MKINAPVKKNEDYLIDIDSMGYDGEGVGKVEGFTVFVAGAIKGERVRIKIVKVSKNFAFGKLLEVIKPSSERTAPSCPIYKRCGGCNIQHITYKGQLEFKKTRVFDALTRIGKFDGEFINGVIHDTIGMENPVRYRNKVQLPVGKVKNSVKIGFYAQRSHEIIDMVSCGIQNEQADEVSKVVREWIEKYNINVYDETTGKGFVRHIVVRTGFKTGEVMAVIVTNGENFPNKDELIESLVKNVKGIKSIVQNINDKIVNVIMGKKCITIWGKDTITDYIGKLKFKISPLSFFQVNSIQTEVLYGKTLEFAGLTGNETVFDAYCGTGTISLFLSEKAKKVYGVEIVNDAILNARENAIENGISNAEFITGKSELEIPKLIEKGIKADVVVVDPPRKGCDKVLLDSILKMQPDRIVYVSCDPGTLARDLAILCQNGEELNDSQYKIKEVQPVDMFPMTSHVETVVLLKKAEK